MRPQMTFLLANLALAFYNVGTIWAHEIDIFRAWKHLDLKTFRAAQGAHWKALSYLDRISWGRGQAVSRIGSRCVITSVCS